MGDTTDSEKGMNKNMILASSIDFRKGEEKKYLLRFEAKGEKAGEMIKVNFKTRDNQIVCTKEFRLEPFFQRSELLYIPTFANIPYERINFEFSDLQSAVWIKNISFQEADVTIPDPNDHFMLVINDTRVLRSVPVAKGFVDVSRKVQGKSVILRPYSSSIFFKK